MIEYSMQGANMNPNNLSVETIDDKQFHEQGSHLLQSIELALEAADDAFDFYVINISTTDAEDASITTNTGWTPVGSMDIEAYSAANKNSSAKFRARKTGSAAWTIYRIA